MLVVAFVAAAAVEIVFARVRKKPVGGGALVFAVLLVLILPFDTGADAPAGAASQPAAAEAVSQPATQPGTIPLKSIPLWMVALGSAFGIFFGKEIFGGTGHHLFSPVLVGKGFLMFSYPTVVKGSYFGSMLDIPGEPTPWMIASAVILLGAVAMIVARPGNWQTLVAIVATGAGLGYLMESIAAAQAGATTQATQAAMAVSYLPYDSVLKLLAADGFLFGVCFLACDPACSPRTAVGKWIYGVLIGGVAVLMRCFSNYSEAMLSAVLMGNLFAPMLDVIVRGLAGRRAESEG